ncbi:uncharacterized protein BXZ73DRAFT_48537 [Epithele typhae]|uniref:uncharacterized protein n=1 Tax=Epithele typhae TaxID=378194 RepID=UPI002007FF04|nr:uncharacterized protein BXZ73DRAFT_48537 [Epithele typhae]KAH9927934.1 hypothetical protein BXZ73DRAFT_48537 [Epithele typhae]
MKQQSVETEEDWGDKYGINPPKWLNEHPAIVRRGVVVDQLLRHFHVYQTAWFVDPGIIVKIPRPDTHEISFYRELQKDPESRNYIMPCEIVDDEKHPLMIFPIVSVIYAQQHAFRWPWSRVLKYYDDMLQTVTFLHHRRIAHMDIAMDNFLFSDKDEVLFGQQMHADRPYIIDFERSRQLPLGPGLQPPIDLPPSIIPKPGGIIRRDPYSWDMYCLGWSFYHVYEVNLYRAKSLAPRLVTWYFEWVRGKADCPCPKICSCRPDAHRARYVLFGVRFLVHLLELTDGIFCYTARLFRA